VNIVFEYLCDDRVWILLVNIECYDRIRILDMMIGFEYY